MMKPRAYSYHGPRDPITIHEDDSVQEQKASKDSSTSKTSSLIRRCVSVPTTLFDVESILKWKTVDESLHSTYGSDDGMKMTSRFSSSSFAEIGYRLY